MVVKGVVCTVSVAGILSSSMVQICFTVAQSIRGTTVPFQDAHLTMKLLLGAVFHKFSTDSDLRRVPVGKGYMCACMKQLVARAEAGSATRE